MKTNWTLGNFSVTLECEPNQEQALELQRLGLLYLGQRISKVDKTLGGFIGKERRKGWKRNDAAFSEDLASKLVGDFKELEFPTDGVSKLTPTVSIVEYVREEQSTKEAELVAGDKESKGTLDEWAREHGVSETHTPDGESYSPELLAAITRKIREVRKAALASV